MDSPIRTTALGETNKLSHLQVTIGDNMHHIFDTIRSSKNFLLESMHVLKPMKMNEKASMMVEGTIRDSGQFIV